MIEKYGGDDGDRTRTRTGRFQGVAARAKWLCFQYAPGSVVHVVTAHFRGMVARWLHGVALRTDLHACRSDHVQIIAFHLVDQQPVQFDVAIAVMAPLASQGMVVIARRQGLALDQQQDDLRQLLPCRCRAFARALHRAGTGHR